MPKLILNTVVLSALLLSQLPALALDQQYLNKEIEKIEKSSKGSLGVAAYDFKTGESWYLNGDKSYRMQSVGKLPIAIAVLKEVDAGKLNLDSEIKLTKKDVLAIRKSSVPDNLPLGTKSCSVRSLMERMISRSNNGAADVLTRTIGGVECINKVLKDSNIEGIRVDRLYSELTKPGAASEMLDTATPKAICDLLLKLEQGKVLSTKSTASLLAMMHKTTTGVNRIKAGVPPKAKVAHKTGTGPVEKGRGVSTNDVAIVTKPNGDKLIVAVFLENAPGSDSTRDGVVAAVSRSVCKATQ